MNTALVDYAKSLDCIHCGLCLRTCPTYQVTGSEASSPRGRIFAMRGVAEGELDADKAFADEMDACLVCRHCESVCPAGVQFGAMMETTRDALNSSGKSVHGPFTRVLLRVGLRHILTSRRLLHLAHSFLRLAQRTRVLKLVAPLLGARGATLAYLPAVPANHGPPPPFVEAEGNERGCVAVLSGCVLPELFPHVADDTIRVLQACGYSCASPEGHTCCGALHAHNGDLETARNLARATIEDFATTGGVPIVVNSAGCGAHMKEYERLLENDAEWAPRARTFAARVIDLTEFLARPDELAVLKSRLGLPDPDRFPAPVAYDDPCHLCHGQNVQHEPRELLDSIQGLQRVELVDSDSCCGSAGIYSLLRPKDGQRILEPKLERLAESGARTLITANPGCQMQWHAGLAMRGNDSVRVVHIAELLASAVSQR